MSIHLYCVMPHDSRGALPPGLSGLAGAEVRALPVDHLVANFSSHRTSLLTMMTIIGYSLPHNIYV